MLRLKASDAVRVSDVRGRALGGEGGMNAIDLFIHGAWEIFAAVKESERG